MQIPPCGPQQKPHEDGHPQQLRGKTDHPHLQRNHQQHGV